MTILHTQSMKAATTRWMPIYSRQFAWHILKCHSQRLACPARLCPGTSQLTKNDAVVLLHSQYCTVQFFSLSSTGEGASEGLWFQEFTAGLHCLKDQVVSSVWCLPQIFHINAWTLARFKIQLLIQNFIYLQHTHTDNFRSSHHLVSPLIKCDNQMVDWQIYDKIMD